MPVPDIEYGFTGMGSELAWHGHPDPICNLPVLVSIICRESEEDSDSLDGTRSPIKAKVKLRYADFKQVVGQAVVASFVNHNWHPVHIPMVPSVGVVQGELRAALYNCISDTLFVLYPSMEYFSVARKKFSIGGIRALWLLLHHKIFLNREMCKFFTQNIASSLKNQFQSPDCLKYFLELHDYGIPAWPDDPLI